MRIDYSMNAKEELILKILSSVDSIKGKTKFVKILHMVCKLLEKNNIQSPFEFKAAQYGVYPLEFDPMLDVLQKNNFIQINFDPLAKRQDFTAFSNTVIGVSNVFSAVGTQITELVQALNPYSSDEVIAISYHLFPETTVNSTIKPIINKKITDMFSPLSQKFEKDVEEIATPLSINNESKPLYPQFNDMDARLHLMESLGLKELPPIIPNLIDTSTGFLSKKYSIFKKYNLEELLEDARRR